MKFIIPTNDPLLMDFLFLIKTHKDIIPELHNLFLNTHYLEHLVSPTYEYQKLTETMANYLVYDLNLSYELIKMFIYEEGGYILGEEVMDQELASDTLTKTEISYRYFVEKNSALSLTDGKEYLLKVTKGVIVKK